MRKKYDAPPPHSLARSRRRKWPFLLALLVLCAGLYILMLVASPLVTLPFIGGEKPHALNTADDADDFRNRIQIERMQLEVPFYEGGTEALDKGAWHRYPERGNPKQGGNFILSAHRFDIGLTPLETQRRSPFYRLDLLHEGDGIRVFYDNQWYDYTVTRIYSVKPDAVEIEAPSDSAKLTLYSCSLEGSADGRYVVEAHLRS